MLTLWRYRTFNVYFIHNYHLATFINYYKYIIHNSSDHNLKETYNIYLLGLLYIIFINYKGIKSQHILKQSTIFISRIMVTWQNSWNNIHLSNTLINLKPNVEKWKYLPDITRKNGMIFTGAKIGYTHLMHSCVISIEPKPTCDICRLNLLIQHIITDCPKFNDVHEVLINPTSIHYVFVIKRSSTQFVNFSIKLIYLIK